jgi:hypothetical protein
VVTTASRSDILERLGTASRRGRLPGYTAGGGGGLFSVAAHGHPFDGLLTGRYVPGDGGQPGRMVFELRLLPKLPAIFAIVLILSIWPGVWFTDELIAQYLPGLWRPWVTYYWYLPLTVIPLPWAWASLMRKSRDSTRQAALEAIEKIAGEVGGSVV